MKLLYAKYDKDREETEAKIKAQEEKRRKFNEIADSVEDKLLNGIVLNGEEVEWYKNTWGEGAVDYAVATAVAEQYCKDNKIRLDDFLEEWNFIICFLTEKSKDAPVTVYWKSTPLSDTTSAYSSLYVRAKCYFWSYMKPMVTIMDSKIRDNVSKEASLYALGLETGVEE